MGVPAVRGLVPAHPGLIRVSVWGVSVWPGGVPGESVPGESVPGERLAGVILVLCLLRGPPRRLTCRGVAPLGRLSHERGDTSGRQQGSEKNGIDFHGGSLQEKWEVKALLAFVMPVTVRRTGGSGKG